MAVAEERSVENVPREHIFCQRAIFVSRQRIGLEQEVALQQTSKSRANPYLPHRVELDSFVDIRETSTNAEANEIRPSCYIFSLMQTTLLIKNWTRNK